MAWPLWLLAGLAWLALWMWIFARFAAGKNSDALVAMFHSLLPVFCVFTCLAAFLAVPGRAPLFHKMILWTHHASVLLLFLFLLAAEYWQVEGWWRIRCGEGAESAAASFRRLWVLTEIVPAPIALTIFLTGLRLIWEAPATNSPARLWLFGMVVGFSVFFWDGIFGYQPIVRRMWEEWERAAAARVSKVGGVADAVQLFLHFLSWPLVFLLGLFRWDAVTPFTRPVSQMIAHLSVLSPGWPEVVVASLIWVGAGMTILFLRALHR
jgi:hypothetical protein